MALNTINPTRWQILIQDGGFHWSVYYIWQSFPLPICLVLKIYLKNCCQLWWTPINLTLILDSTFWGVYVFNWTFQRYKNFKTFKINMYSKIWSEWPLVWTTNLQLQFDNPYSCKGLFCAFIQTTYTISTWQSRPTTTLLDKYVTQIELKHLKYKQLFV